MAEIFFNRFKNRLCNRPKSDQIRSNQIKSVFFGGFESPGAEDPTISTALGPAALGGPLGQPPPLRGLIAPCRFRGSGKQNP